MMKKLIIPSIALVISLLFACNNANQKENSESETSEETVSDFIENDSAIQNDLENANRELEEMMKADEK